MVEIMSMAGTTKVMGMVSMVEMDRCGGDNKDAEDDERGGVNEGCRNKVLDISVVGMKKVVRTMSAVERWMSVVGTAKVLERMTMVGMMKAVGTDWRSEDR